MDKIFKVWKLFFEF